MNEMENERPVHDVFLVYRILTVNLNVYMQITAYLMELAPPRPEEAIKLVDKVAGIEWLIQKYEVDGAAAIKLNLLLDNPIILVPRNSLTRELVFFLVISPSVGIKVIFWFIYENENILSVDILTLCNTMICCFIKFCCCFDLCGWSWYLICAFVFS